MLGLFALASGFLAPTSRTGRATAVGPMRSTGNIQMINLFGNNEESKLRRDDLSLRSARAGSRVLTFRRPNAATTGLLLGLKFKEGAGKAIYIQSIVPNTQAADFEKQGKLSVGDEITMVSATFGDEMWSARGVGKMRLEKSIAVRQGATISFVLESSDDNSKKRMKEMAAKQKKEQDRISRLQRQLTKE